MRRKLKSLFLVLAYLWIRFDPVLRLTFRNNWVVRSEFLSTLFGEDDVRAFLKHRVKLKKMRSKKLPPIILPSQIDKQVQKFLTAKITTKTGHQQKLKIINQLIFWSTDEAINKHNIESYKTRSAIIEALLTTIFNNSLKPDINIILDGLKHIVFSRTTYMGAKGEPSPIVHNIIIANCARLLTTHFTETIRLRDGKLDQLTKIKLIKEIKDSKKDRGSIAFSANSVRQKDDFEHRFPLKSHQAKLLVSILDHYRHSAWPDSRKTATNIIKKIEKQLGLKLTDLDY